MLLGEKRAALLGQLMDGKPVAYSQLGESLASELLGEGLLTLRANGSRRSLSAIDRAALRSYLLAKFPSLKLSSQPSQTATPRALMAAATGNSKLTASRSCPGFPVNAYEPIGCKLGTQPLTLCPPEGTFVYVCDWQHFEVPADVVIVGIENVENFRLVGRERALFERVLPDRRLLFVSRYPQSHDLCAWLMRQPNRYVHFGDFDLAGVHIYLSEFQRHIGGRASLLIPPDIEDRLAQGSLERYNRQLARFGQLHTDVPDAEALIRLIHKHHRGYDQEGYIAAPVAAPQEPTEPGID